MSSEAVEEPVEDGFEVPDSRRPALRKLTDDIGEMRRALLGGFDTRREVLLWAQKLTVRTLGQLPHDWYEGLAREFRIDSEGRDGVFLSVLLTPDNRTREIPETAAQRARRKEFATRILPTLHPSFRELRKDAGEYVGESEASHDEDRPGHDPEQQRYIAMRPAFNEIETIQQEVLMSLLVGFAHEDAILEWGEEIELATHGEPILPDAPGTFVARCYQEDGTRDLLLADDYQARCAREWFAARYLLPAFNAGVRDLAGRAGEEPATEDRVESAEMPDWSDMQ